MTAVQFAERIARRSRAGLLTSLAQTEQNDVLQAMNAALQRAYHALPSYLKELTQGFTLPAPVTINNVSVTAGSTALSSGIFSPSQIGCTVQIAGDPQYNQILGTSQLRNPYMGPTGVAATATIYGDALYSTSYPFDRIIGNPKFVDQGAGNLLPQEMVRTDGGGWNYLSQSSIARPVTWWVQYLGNSQGQQPLLVLRFAPKPDQAYGIYLRMAFWPPRLLLTDLQGATTLNLPDQFLEKALIPMGIQELMTTPIWKSVSPEDDQRCEERGNAGEQFLKDQVADPAAPNNRIYCPIGY